MSLYPPEKIEEIRQAADLAQIVSPYVALKRQSPDRYVGLCPFHTEKTPSFHVSPGRGNFHCFGCGAGGGVFDFLMRMENLSFPEAVVELARRYGVSLPEPDRAESRPGVNRTALFAVMEEARKFYEGRLWSDEGAAARRYLAGRGLGRDTARAFGLGLAPEGWDGLSRHLAREGFSDQIAVQAGLIKPRGESGGFYDFFRGRLMVPVADAQGRVVAFSGRVLPGSADEGKSGKYINTGATPLYTKGQILFGLHRARAFVRAAGLAFLVEGCFDLISLAAAGINETVATLGTALTDRQINLLKGLAVPVYLLFDGDEAGREAAAKYLPAFLNAGLEARVVCLPPKETGEPHDPDTFVRAFGAEALKGLSLEAVEIFDYWVETLKRKAPESGGVQAQLRWLDEARELLGRIADSGKRGVVRRRLAGLLQIVETDLEDSRRAPAAVRRGEGRRPDPPRLPAGSEAGEPAPDPAALALLELILGHPETAGPVLKGMAGYWPRDNSLPLFDRLRAAFEARGESGLAAVSGDDLPAPLGGLVARAALAPGVFPPGRAESAARDLMARLARKWGRQRQAELSEGIVRAQAVGDEAGARRLAGEKKEVAARVRALEKNRVE
ncbi:MAG: DNA primase [Candidatus Adiutrix sp.]|jgi:DNA primase|nr:DNA primase [Candidatus Adiutrix sp.]